MTIIEPKPGAMIVGKDVNIILGLPSLPPGNKAAERRLGPQRQQIEYADLPDLGGRQEHGQSAGRTRTSSTRAISPTDRTRSS